MESLQDVLEAISKVYKNCKTYEDAGTARFDSDGECISEIRFRTLAIPPSSLYFEFNDQLSPNNQKYFFSVINGVVRSNAFDVEGDLSLSDCIGRFHGISQGTSSIITTLIFTKARDLLRRRIVDRAFKELREESGDCFTLIGENNELVSCDRADFLIKRAVLPMTTGVGDQTTYLWEFAHLNKPLPLSMFQSQE